MPPLDSHARPLGTMIAYGFARGHVHTDLALAARLGASCVEALPDWRNLPDPLILRSLLADANMILHSAHGCWGCQSIKAPRVDLGHPDITVHEASLDDLKRCLDWLADAGGSHLIVHPGGLSEPEQVDGRQRALAVGLYTLAEHATALGATICVENMPPGVFPGSRMADLANLVAVLDRPEIGLALDTGHAHIAADLTSETLAAGGWLRSTHVHDNNARQDTHLPPGLGTLNWAGWADSLDAIGYSGPIMLECIRHLREHPEVIDEPFLARLKILTG